MFFNCWNACLFYRRVLILKGYCLAAIKDLLWQFLFGRSSNLLTYVVADYSNSGFDWSFPSLYVLQSIDNDWYIIYRFICTRKYKLKCGDIHLISFLATKFKYVCMKFTINELLYRRVWTVYDYRMNLSHVLFVMHQICLINHNLNKKLYFKQLK